MGKARTKRGRAARTDPTGRPEGGGDDAGAEGAAGDAPRPDSIANIVEQVGDVRCGRFICPRVCSELTRAGDELFEY